MTTIEAITEAGDIRGESLRSHIPDMMCRDEAAFLVEYGVRLDDQAMVFHFFPPKEETDWADNIRLDLRLEAQIPKHFDTSKVSAGYVEELRSFYVIVGGLGESPDPWPLVERFLGAVSSESQ